MPVNTWLRPRGATERIPPRRREDHVEEGKFPSAGRFIRKDAIRGDWAAARREGEL